MSKETISKLAKRYEKISAYNLNAAYAAVLLRQAAELVGEIPRTFKKNCVVDNTPFETTRSDAMYCSPKCAVRAFRQRGSNQIETDPTPPSQM